jgi:hypothetical protein
VNDEWIVKYEKAFQQSIVRNTELLQKLQAGRRKGEEVGG